MRFSHHISSFQKTVRLTDEIREKVIREKNEKEQTEARKQEILNGLDMYGV